MPHVERTLKITNKLGLHARAAAKLVQMAARFKSELKIARIDSRQGAGGEAPGNKSSGAQATDVNAKSIMGVLMLAAGMGTTVRLQAEGDDAEEAIAALAGLIEGKFGEE